LISIRKPKLEKFILRASKSSPSDHEDRFETFSREELEEAIGLAIEEMEGRSREYEELVNTLEEKVKSRTRELQHKNKLLEELSIRDDLTQLYNRRFFGEKLREYSFLADRFEYPLSCIMCDIDHFKEFNDTFGHQAGDYILYSIAKILTNNIRRTDVIARYGGEEFVIIMPNTDLEVATTIAEKLRVAIETTTLKYRNKHLKCTASFGVGSGIGENNLHDALVHQADEALYVAKNSGRNKVVGKKL
jgi:diguanylate cyclase (GGDEF)-like protein